MSTPKCEFDYESSYCENEMTTCTQCPVYWDAKGIDPQDGFQDVAEFESGQAFIAPTEEYIVKDGYDLIED